MTKSVMGAKRDTSFLPFTFFSVLITNIFIGSKFCKAEIVIEDVAWTKPYDLDENYFGTCRFVEAPCGHDYFNNDVYLPSGVCVQKGSCQNQFAPWPMEDCQGGTGECCRHELSCSENRTVVVANQLVTNLVSPMMPEDSNAPCTFRFRKQPDICQIRLDFVFVHMGPANLAGDCGPERLRIKNSITVDQDFTTCGDLTGQHMYLTFGSGDYIDVSVNPTYDNMWGWGLGPYHIIATMIPCRSKNRAPDHCLQYFTKRNGQVASFDFGGQQQNNQRYSICVKPSDESTSVQWKPCSNQGLPRFPLWGRDLKSFDITSNSDAVPLTCNTDWVQVKGQNSVCEPFVETNSAWKPYELLVNFDGSELPPPPPGFTLPVNPENCAAECVSSDPSRYDCACLPLLPPPGGPVCQCVLSSPGYPVPPADFANIGFCLEYTQM